MSFSIPGLSTGKAPTWRSIQSIKAEKFGVVVRCGSDVTIETSTFEQVDDALRVEGNGSIVVAEGARTCGRVSLGVRAF